VITTQAVSTDPMTGKESPMRIVDKWESDSKFVEEFYEKRGPKRDEDDGDHLHEGRAHEVALLRALRHRR